MIDLSQHFDDFNLRARVYPALLLSFPALANVLLLWPAGPLVRLVPLAVSVGVVFFVADLVRGAGQALEQRLSRRWGGLPAQRALWFTGTDNAVLTERRRATVERLLGRRLPTVQLETRNPQRALQMYDAAVRELIPRVRGKGQDELLHGENIRYNFRRNALAVRKWALGVAAFCAAGDTVAVVAGHHRPSAATALAVSVIAIATWAMVVREPWVLQAAGTYRERFYDAMGRLPETAPGT